ncbi:MAG: thioredoxin domain-containing protein [Myxococcota bacterium]
MGWLGKLLGLEAEPHAVVSVSDANYKAEVLDSELPVLLDVWSDGCGPCKMLEPVVMDLSRKYKGRLRVAEMNVANGPKTARKLGVSATPTVLYFHKGRVVERVVGYRAGHYHQTFLEQELLPKAAPERAQAAKP